MESLVENVFKLPELAVNGIVAVFLLLILSVFSFFFPFIGHVAVGMLFLVLGIFLKDVYIDKDKNLSLTVPLVIMGLGILLFSMLGISLEMYAVTFSMLASRVVMMTVINIPGLGPVNLETFGIDTTMVGSIITVLLGSAVGSVVVTKILKSGKKGGRR